MQFTEDVSERQKLTENHTLHASQENTICKLKKQVEREEENANDQVI